MTSLSENVYTDVNVIRKKSILDYKLRTESSTNIQSHITYVELPMIIVFMLNVMVGTMICMVGTCIASS